ncbi:YARHG domain-containing protein [Phreatobacter stygius]|uniref:YARHG domain-containing protein n=1 Tax=Phreatobacter stygius TaxID=1940610 RepID=A0A4D7B309_9HYPH|nr:YARHG domain-containing protein [Phreatobacter stygius]QCI64958.1 YARHG domain-containing protein [Phreatobacter stygius]
MKRKVRRAIVAAAVLICSAAPVVAQDYRGWSCRDLWVERNQIYKDAGYCFRTPRAISYFGNGGCSYDRQADVPLSQTQRRIIADVTRAERYMGCVD